MIAPLSRLQKLVFGNSGETSEDPFLLRLEDALRAVREGRDDVGSSDLAILLRQGIIRCSHGQAEISELRVPRGEPWPDERIWALFGCTANPAGVKHLLVRPRRWQPVWLDPAAPEVVEAAVREEQRRRPRLIPTDPGVTEFTGLTEYLSPGLAAAVRAVFLMPAGSTLLINLPTGAGKTLAFQLPALTWATEAGLTLVIVPTVALARDQEDRFQALVSKHPQGRAWSGKSLAYHSGLDDESRRSIRDAIRNGGIPVVFASPEAALGALRGPLFAASREGRLRIFAVDEAHIISQWGQQFRPEFQAIAGLRDALLAECPPDSRFRTLLLSATVTSECYETLRVCFGRICFQMVSEVAIRPEPGFLIDSAVDKAEQIKKVSEALRYLPRPLILYTTLREHAESWEEYLRKAGFRRLRLVRGGDLSDQSGEQTLFEWRNRKIDIIVATSAFGLGVDQAEIRSVVHACLPETIDRYYQEIGRAGRDGNAAVALLVSTPQDMEAAERLAKERLITVDRAFERWESMWVHRQPLSQEIWLVSLDDKPADIAHPSRENSSWNLRTLVLMARAGLIEFAAHPPPDLEPKLNEDEPAFEQRRREAIEQFKRQVAIRISHPGHSLESHWNDVVARTRAQLRAADEAGARLVRELRDLRRPLNELFRQVYTIPDPLISPPRFPGNCPVTRTNRTMCSEYPDPDITTITETAATLSASLDRALAPCSDEVGRSWVAYVANHGDAKKLREWRDQILMFLRYAVSGGIVELSLPEGLIRETDWSQLGKRASFRLLFRTTAETVFTHSPPVFDMPVPRLTLLGERDTEPDNVSRIMRINRPRHVILLPRDVTDPTRPDRRLLDVKQHLSIADVLTRLAS
jgi:ATP-dependent DNA helicase RecQ